MKDRSDKYAGENFLTWEAGVPLMTNLFILYDLLVFSGLAWFVPSTLVSVIVSWLEPPADPAVVFSVFKLMAAIVLIFLGFFFVAGVFFLRNRFFARYVLNGSGSDCETAKGASPKISFTSWAHFFSAAPWPVPEGSVSGWGKGKWIEWHRVRAVVPHRWCRTVTLSSGWVAIQRLYCPDQKTYEQVLAICLEEVERAGREKAGLKGK